MEPTRAVDSASVKPRGRDFSRDRLDREFSREALFAAGLARGDAAHLADFEADEIANDPALQRFAAQLDAHLAEMVGDMSTAWPAADLEAARAAAAA